MKLDSRIIEGKKPLTCFDCEEAKHFIGRQGYFSDHVTDFADLDDTAGIAILGMVNDSNWNYPFMATGHDLGRARYFLPKEWVENEPEWRSYLIDEWLQEHNFGDMIEFRHKSIKRELTVMFTGQVREIDGTIRIILGANAYDFDELFEYYELIDKTNDGKFVWKPFGVEVK